MEHEERWGVRSDVGDRRGLLPAGAIAVARGLEHPLGEELGQLGVVGAVLIGEVVHAVERNGRGDAGVGVLETGLEVGEVRGQRGEGAQVATRRAAGDDDEARVAAVTGDVRLGPGERPLDVDDLVGPCRPRRQPVVGGDAHPALFGEVGHQRLTLAFLAAHRPGATVDLEQHGRSGVAAEVTALPHVELVPDPELPVADVACRPVAPPHARLGCHQLPAGQRHLGPGRERLADTRAVVGPQALRQRRVEDATRPARRAVHDDETGHGGDVGGDPDLSTPASGPTTAGQQPSDGQLRQSRVQRELRRSEPEGQRRQCEPTPGVRPGGWRWPSWPLHRHRR